MQERPVVQSYRHEQAAAVHAEQVADAGVSHIVDVRKADIEGREFPREPARREAWLRDQYQHPEEHWHTLGEVQNWVSENGVEYVRTDPSALIGETPDDLFTAAGDTWGPEAWLGAARLDEKPGT